MKGLQIMQENETQLWDEYVKIMVLVVDESVDDEGAMSQESFNILGSLFGEIPPEHRAKAFIDFRCELDARNIPYSITHINQ